MIHEELYNKTVSILVDAYFNEKLISQDCTACAVGNIISTFNGYERVEIANKSHWLTKTGDYIKPKWIDVFGTPAINILGFRYTKKQFFNKDKIDLDAKNEIEKTGYKIHELALIENAFEKGYKGKDKMFNALMNVIDFLDEIHKNKNVLITQKTKKLFKVKPVSQSNS